MFRHEGPARDARKNALLAGYLALVAGFINSSGFLRIGTFTSHVTGSVGRFSIDLASGRLSAALLAGAMVTMFLLGAFGASLILEMAPASERNRAYGFALFVEAALLVGFVVVSGISTATHPRILDAEAVILCVAMGMQNSLVTRLSGAVVRTTHLTGVTTDIGIELARWCSWRYRKASGAERPSVPKGIILVTIAAAFTLGAILGALSLSRWIILAPASAISLAGIYAFFEPREP